MNIFLYDDYKAIIRASIERLPNRGRGQIGKIAKVIGVHQSFVSQVLNTERNFSEEQTYFIGIHLKFSELEIEYLIALLHLAKTVNPGLKTVLRRHVQQLKNNSNPDDGLDRSMKSLEEGDKQIFYSNWIYMAVWLLTSIEKFQNFRAISKHLKIADAKLTEVIEFLVHVGLCGETNGKLSMNVKRTLVTKNSLMLNRHHANWRLKGLEAQNLNQPGDLFYSSPMTISKKDAQQINKILIRTIAVIEPLVEPSQAEEAYSLNIDWFKF